MINYVIVHISIRTVYLNVQIDSVIHCQFFSNNSCKVFKFSNLSVSGRCYTNSKFRVFMVTSSNGNIFCVTGHLCGEFTGTGEFPVQRPVTGSCDVFFDLRLNKRLSKQSWGAHYDVTVMWKHLMTVNCLNGFLAELFSGEYYKISFIVSQYCLSFWLSLMASGNKPLPGRMLTDIYKSIWRHYATIGSLHRDWLYILYLKNSIKVVF